MYMYTTDLDKIAPEPAISSHWFLQNNRFCLLFIMGGIKTTIQLNKNFEYSTVAKMTSFPNEM